MICPTYCKHILQHSQHWAVNCWTILAQLRLHSGLGHCTAWPSESLSNQPLVQAVSPKPYLECLGCSSTKQQRAKAQSKKKQSQHWLLTRGCQTQSQGGFSWVPMKKWIWKEWLQICHEVCPDFGDLQQVWSCNDWGHAHQASCNDACCCCNVVAVHSCPWVPWCCNVVAVHSCPGVSGTKCLLLCGWCCVGTPAQECQCL